MPISTTLAAKRRPYESDKRSGGGWLRQTPNIFNNILKSYSLGPVDAMAVGKKLDTLIVRLLKDSPTFPISFMM